MKKTIITVLISIVITAATIVVLLEIEAQEHERRPDDLVQLESLVLGEEREILIHFPHNYDSTKAYPILYVLDGSSQDYRMADIGQLLSRAGVVPELIVVGIPNTNRNRDLTPHFGLMDTEGDEYGSGDRFLAFLTEEVTPFIENNYPFNGHRMLAGHSRAGLFSFYAFLQQPEAFDSYFSFSPAFWRDDILILEKAKQFFSTKKSLSNFFYLSLGTEENPKMKKGYDSVVELLDTLNVEGLTIRHSFTNKANHGNNLYHSTPEALKLWNNYYIQQ